MKPQWDSNPTSLSGRNRVFYPIKLQGHFCVGQVGLEPTSLPEGTGFTDRRAHQLLN